MDLGLICLAAELRDLLERDRLSELRSISEAALAQICISLVEGGVRIHSSELLRCVRQNIFPMGRPRVLAGVHQWALATS